MDAWNEAVSLGKPLVEPQSMSCILHFVPCMEEFWILDLVGYGAYDHETQLAHGLAR